MGDTIEKVFKKKNLYLIFIQAAGRKEMKMVNRRMKIFGLDRQYGFLLDLICRGWGFELDD